MSFVRGQRIYPICACAGRARKDICSGASKFLLPIGAIAIIVGRTGWLAKPAGFGTTEEGAQMPQENKL